MKKKVAVGLSGGVDSAVAAALLQEAGYEVIGITMKIWNGKVKLNFGQSTNPLAPLTSQGKKSAPTHDACFGPSEAEDIAVCERLAAQLKFPYYAIDLSSEYEKTVLDYFRAEYLQGRTPNPCVVCNREMKFGFLVQAARRLGLDFDYFATGHYARIGQLLGHATLRRARNEAKDQSYFIHSIKGLQLDEVLFPLGELTKEEVRQKARAIGLEVADKIESQDFIAGGDYSPVFEGIQVTHGNIVDQDGKILGAHKGLPYYTIGQRRGLGIASSEPLYVIKIDAQKNEVIVGPNEGLFAEGLSAENMFIHPGLLELTHTQSTHVQVIHEQVTQGDTISFRAQAKLRQNHKAAACTVTLNVNTPDKAKLSFDIAQRAVTPGQSAVLYNDEGFVIGGGLIKEKN